MTATDRLITVFEARGAGSLIATFTGIARAHDTLAKGQAKVANATSGAQIRQGISQVRNALQQLVTANLAAAAAAGTLFAGMAYGLERAIQGYTKLGREIMNLRDLTGSSTGDASRATALFRIAGVNDASAAKQVLGLNKAVFTPSGQGALARLGIPANPNQSGLQLFNQVADRLNQMQDGIRKTQILTDLFGEEGARSILPLLRLTEQQREAAMSLADAYDAKGLRAIQNFDVASNMLGATFQNKLIAPLVQAVLPAVTAFANGITAVINLLHKIDRATHGSLSFVAAWGGVAVGVALAVTAMQRFGAAIKAAITLAKQLAVVQGIIASFSNPVKAAVGIGLAVASVGAITALVNANSGGSADEASSKFSDSVKRFGVSVERLANVVDATKGRGLPSGLSQQDVGALQRRMALDAIG